MTEDSPAVLFYGGQRSALLEDPNITERKIFGTTALCTGGKVFMFPWKDTLVLKLPADVVEELVASGKGELFDPGHGRTSKTWAAIYSVASDRWSQLAVTAREFVAG
jgi:TfoX/Sxy family transcriptional regulator of competence genes